MNRASLDRGFGRCVVLRKHGATLKKYANRTQDRITLPAAAAVAAKQRLLVDALAAAAWLPDGPASAWFYDPPWTLPWLRRNEVSVPVVARTR